MAKAPTKGAQSREVLLQIPKALGLSKGDIDSLKKSFRNELVSSMREKALASIRLVVKIRLSDV